MLQPTMMVIVLHRLRWSSHADSTKSTDGLACPGLGCYLPRLCAVAAVRLAGRCCARLPIQAVLLRARGALLKGAEGWSTAM